MAAGYDEETLIDEFPFCLADDEGLENTIQEYIEVIHLMVIERNFEGIELLGQTLKELEAERDIRRKNRH